MQRQHALTWSSFNRLEFEYDPEIECLSHSKIITGKVDKECQYCHTLKLINESAEICCATGNVTDENKIVNYLTEFIKFTQFNRISTT